MKLTKNKLKQIIKEELNKVLNESKNDPKVRDSLNRLEKALSALGYVDIRSGKYMTQIDGEALPNEVGGAINGTTAYVGRDEGSKGTRVAIVWRDGSIEFDDNEIAAAAKSEMGH